MKLYEKKNTESGVTDIKDVDTTSRRVKVAISRMGNLDLDNDVIDKTAYNKTIKERGPKGSNLIWHLTDHAASLKYAIAKFSELSTEGDYLVGVTDIPKTNWGNDMMEFYATGNINQHSVGFRTIKSEPVNAGKPDEHRLIKEILLYEGSAVLWAANPDTDTISVGKSLPSGMIECPHCNKPTKDIEAGMGYIRCVNCNNTFSSQKDIKKSFFDTLKEVNNLAKLFRSGHLTDETFELLEIQLTQKTEILQQLYQYTTQPAGNAVEPEQGKGLLDVITTFNNTLILQNESRRIKEAIS